MKFFFPDSTDLVDPRFDFETETGLSHRVHQREEWYAHEAISTHLYDGILISKAAIDPKRSGNNRYSQPQINRLLRVGAREFFRLNETCGQSRLETMGDCGSFSHMRDGTPIYRIDEVIDFYVGCGLDYGFSIDLIILEYKQKLDDPYSIEQAPPEWKRKQESTLELAAEFLQRHRARRCKFVPIAVAQGWSPNSYAKAARELQRMGYTYIALGGLAMRKTVEILACLEAVNTVRSPNTRLHLLGTGRVRQAHGLQRCGVASFDSASPMRYSFSAKDNYFTERKAYVAIWLPQLEGNASVERKVKAGLIKQDEALRWEKTCLDVLRLYDKELATMKQVLEALEVYTRCLNKPWTREREYIELLTDKPWKTCPCDVCLKVGIEVVIFRGLERNKRRGFHNLYVFAKQLRKGLEVINTPTQLASA